MFWKKEGFMNTYIIENEIIRATVSQRGCELISVIRKEDNREYMWCGDPVFWKRHSPVLFPLVGKLKENTYRYEGIDYKMSQHGFARDMDFEVTKKTDTEIRMTLCETEDTFKQFPFTFELECGFQLEGNQIQVLWQVRNTNKKEMYFSIGGHPAFATPPGKDNMVGTTMLFDSHNQTMRYGLLNENGLLKEETYEVELQQRTVEVKKDLFDQDAWIIENNQAHKVSLLENGQAFVTVEFDAPVFGLWSPAGKEIPFLCIEPWYGRSDSTSFHGDLSQREWENNLLPGEVFDRNYKIIFG